MKRTRLIWLAVGIIVGLIAAAIPSLFRSAEPTMYLMLREPWGEETADEDKKTIHAAVLEKAWACGGRDFVAELPTHATEVYIPIKPKNLKVANCVIEAVRDADIPITITNSGK